MRREIIGALYALVSAIGACASPSVSSQPAPRDAGRRFDVVWRPVRDGTPEVAAIEVTQTLHGVRDSSAFSLRAPVTYAGVRGIADRVQRLTVSDGAGPVPLSSPVDDPADPGGFPYYRRWRAERPVRGAVVVTYRSLVQPPPGGGPPFGIRAAAGGVSGAGSGFLVVPERQDTVLARVHWDLSDLAAGSTAVTTFGEGDFELRAPPEELMQGWIMAGPLGRYPEQGPRRGFSAAWLGTPSFDVRQEMAWAADMYDFLAKSYRYLDPAPPYRVFIRVLPSGGRGATALQHSFMLSTGPGAPGGAARAPRETMTHEMGHMWVGGIEGPIGVTSWFSEGLNTYYTRLLPMRGGFDSVSVYGQSINAAFRNYYTSRARNLSADSIVKIGFNDDEVRHIPYVRGSMYFADLDSKLRAASGGRRNLDSLMLELFRRRERGERFDHAAWVAAVTKELGPTAGEQFEAVILRGETIVPAPDAFGPCFERRPTTWSLDGGRQVEGFEWVRVASIPDTQCRES